MTRRRRNVPTRIAAAFCALAAASCGPIARDVVGEYNDAAEVLDGQVVFDPLGGDGALTLRGERSGLQCEGVLRIGAPSDDPIACDGMKGDFDAFCDDGRRLTGDWRARSCSSGAATGEDTRGLNFSFFFGAEPEDARAYLDAARRHADERPGLKGEPTAAGRRSDVAGFFVTTSGGFVTAAAPFGRGQDVDVRTADGAVLSGRIVAIDAVNGLAVGAVDAPSAALPLARPGAPRAGVVLTALAIDGPRVMLAAPDLEDPRAMAGDGRLNGAALGGPIVDHHGRVVGVVAAGPDAKPQPIRIAYATALLGSAGFAPSLLAPGGARFDPPTLARTYRPALVTVEPR